MNYYEYAPPFLRWLHYTGIKPWQLFSWIFRISLFLGIILFFVSIFAKKRKPVTRIVLLVIGISLLIWGTRLDKYYLNYEQHKICSMPAIYIKKQVPANGYIEIRPGNINLNDKDIFSIRDTPPIGEDIWIEKEPKYCEQVTKYDGYHFSETADLSWNSEELRFAKDFDYLDLEGLGGKKKYKYNVEYTGIKNGICYQAYLNKPQSRYYLMSDIGPRRLGLGTKRYKAAIYDSLTGEEIAYSNRYVLATNAWSKLILGGFGSTNSYCGNEQITTEGGNPIKEYRKATQYERNTFMMTRYTLIPEEYFYTQQVK